MWNDIYKPDSIGSEGGTIIADEEYKSIVQDNIGKL